MKDLKRLAAECERDLRSIGIVPGKVVGWQINTRAKRRWGQCKKLPDGTFTISIAASLMEDSVCDQATKNTVMHELLHTVQGCHGHTGKWKMLADTINRRLPSYTIKRTTEYGEKGIAKPPSKYVIQCTKCGKEYGRERMSPVVKNYTKYRCSCGGTFRRVR